ncbi:hypothetical protein HFD88_010512 [Aspergillus terreus]|nr:hypothetical protein HFD88_010512 [Aspergillus terreus]
MEQQDVEGYAFAQALSAIITSQNSCTLHEQCDSHCSGRVGVSRYHLSPSGVRSNEVDLRADLARLDLSSSKPTRTEPLTISADTPMFTYTSLKESNRRIRLLKVKPGIFRADPVDAELAEFEFDKAPAYGALSYCWGKDLADKKILCNGRVFHVTSSLERSLKQLRAGFLPGDREEWIWADAICINQHDIGEKNAQIRLMEQIYSTAQTVYIDLAGLGGLSMQVDGFELRFGDTVGGLGSQDLLTESDHPSHPFHFRTAFLALKQPWFTRTWVIQEMALAKKAKYIFHGNIFTQPELDAILTREALQSRPERARELMTGGAVLMRGYLNYQKMQTIKHAYLSGRKDSLQFIQLTSDFVASDPKDKIFGLLALFNDNDRRAIGPYSQDVYSVYRRFAALQVRLGHAIMMLDSAGLQKRRLDSGQFASWVPDWTAQSGNVKNISTLRPVPYRASASSTPRIELLGDAGSTGLQLRGLLVDRLTSVVPFANPDGPDPSFLDYHNRIRAHFDSWLRRSRSAYRDNEDAFARLLLMDDTYIGANAIAYSSPIHSPAQTYREALQRWQAGSDGGLKGQRMDAVETFQMQARTTCLERSFAITTNGRIALVPRMAAAGDVVALFYGATVPYLVRPAKGGFVLLGDAYVGGVMYGEAVSGGHQGRDIVLV